MVSFSASVSNSFLVCSHSLNRNLTGMAIADITLLSGFQAETLHLDTVRCSLFLLFFIVILCTEWEGASCHVTFFFSIDKLR